MYHLQDHDLRPEETAEQVRMISLDPDLRRGSNDELNQEKAAEQGELEVCLLLLNHAHHLPDRIAIAEDDTPLAQVEVRLHAAHEDVHHRSPMRAIVLAEPTKSIGADRDLVLGLCRLLLNHAEVDVLTLSGPLIDEKITTHV